MYSFVYHLNELLVRLVLMASPILDAYNHESIFSDLSDYQVFICYTDSIKYRFSFAERLIAKVLSNRGYDLDLEFDESDPLECDICFSKDSYSFNASITLVPPKSEDITIFDM